ncbi:MAG: hypothetical protein ABIJ09_25490 [Pseudomonadota bacterium]
MGWRRADWLPWAMGLLMLAVGAPGKAEGVTQDIPGHGQIDWTAKTITARGSGAPSKKAKSPAAARLGAERAAKLDAYRNILETLKGVQVDAKRSADKVLSGGEIQAKVDGVIKGAKVIDTVYYSDLSVDVVLRMPIDGLLTQALLPETATEKKKDVPTKGTAKSSGLVINAKGLNVIPAIAPRVLDENGKEIYSVAYVADKAAFEGGIIGYVKDLEEAKNHPRVKEKPMVVRAIATGKDGKSDIVISNADADKLRDPETNQAYLADGRVIVVVD